MRIKDSDIGLLGLVSVFGLLIVLLTLTKLLGVINIPWLIVLSPLWVPPAVVISFLLSFVATGLLVIGFVFLVALIMDMFNDIRDTWHRRKRKWEE